MRRSMPSGVLLLAVLHVACGGVASPPPRTSPDFLEHSWKAFKDLYVQPEGYVIDRRLGRVTSEGQGYALLRAAWMGDEATFERTLQWTEDNLRRNDRLYSWHWDPQTRRLVDENTASDADQEIALALILGAYHFDEPAYLERAALLIAAIRRHESIVVLGQRFPAAGNWAVDNRVINLSYFLPYAYPYFAQLDPDGDWSAAVGVGYRLLDQALREDLLVADFAVVTDNGSLAALPPDSQLSRDFSYDAMRVFWRTAVDCLVHDTRRACEDPARTQTLLDLDRRDDGLFSRYRTDGEALDEARSLSFYGSLLPSVQIHFPEQLAWLDERRLRPDALENMLSSTDRYYDQNWIWFGVAAANGLIRERTPSPAEVRRR